MDRAWKQASSWCALSCLTLQNSFERQSWAPFPNEFVIDRIHNNKSCAQVVRNLHEYGLVVFHSTRSEVTTKGGKTMKWLPSTFFLVQGGRWKEESFQKTLTDNRDLRVRVIGYKDGFVRVIKSETKRMNFQNEVVHKTEKPMECNLPNSTSQKASAFSFDHDGYCLDLMQSLYESNALSGPIYGFFIVAEQDVDLLNVVAQAAAKNLVKEYRVHCSGNILIVRSQRAAKLLHQNGLLPTQIRLDLPYAETSAQLIEIFKRVDETDTCFQSQLLFDIWIHISDQLPDFQEAVKGEWLRRAKSQEQNGPDLLRYQIKAVEERGLFYDGDYFAAQDGVHVSTVLKVFNIEEGKRWAVEGAATTLDAVATAEVRDGKYYEDVADRFGIILPCYIDRLKEIWLEYAPAAQLQQDADNARHE